MGLRTGELADSSYVSRKICEMERVICASPAYLERHGEPAAPADLLKHNCLVIAGAPQFHRWPFNMPDGVRSVEVTGNVSANNAETLVQLALLDVGIIRLADVIVGEAIAAGRLRPVLADVHHVEPLPLHAIFPHGRHRSPRVAALVDFLVEKFSDAPWRHRKGGRLTILAPAVAFVDLETTGTSATGDRVTEVAIVRVQDDEMVEEWSTLVDPERSIPPDIQILTGITNEMVRGAPTFAEIRNDVRSRLEGHLFVAHNARFDYGFLKNEFARLEMAFTAEVLCTVRLSRRLYPEAAGHSLDALIARHGLADPLDAVDPTARTRQALGAGRRARPVALRARDRARKTSRGDRRRGEAPAQDPEPAAAAAARCAGRRSGLPRRLPLLRRERPAALHRQEREPARSRAFAFHFRLPQFERPSPLGGDPPPGLDRDRGRTRRVAAGVAAREGGRAPAQRDAAPASDLVRAAPAVASRCAGDGEARGDRLGRARPRRRAPLRALRLAPGSARSARGHRFRGRPVLADPRLGKTRRPLLRAAGSQVPGRVRGGGIARGAQPAARDRARGEAHSRLALRGARGRSWNATRHAASRRRT